MLSPKVERGLNSAAKVCPWKLMAEFDGGFDRDNGSIELAHLTKIGAIVSPPSIFVPTLEIRPNGSPAINEKRFLSN